MDWLAYFEQNRRRHPPISWDAPPALERAVCAVLISSLQRFQLGESGDGDHLRAAARSVGDPRLSAAIDLFVREEQEHARLLAEAIEALGGKLLSGHWSDAWFVRLRRLGGLQTELLVLLAAELVGCCYYRALRDGLRDATLQRLFGRIVRDEEAHIAFHCDTLRSLMAGHSWYRRRIVLTLWGGFSLVVCALVALDHGAALHLAGRSRDDFLTECEELLAQSHAWIVLGLRSRAHHIMAGTGGAGSLRAAGSGGHTTMGRLSAPTLRAIAAAGAVVLLVGIVGTGVLRQSPGHAQDAGVTVTLAPAQSTIGATGRELDVEVLLAVGAGQGTGIDLRVTYPAQALRLESFTPSAAFDQVIVNGPPNNSAGTFRYVGTTLNNADVTGDGVGVGVLRFTGQSDAVASIRATADVSLNNPPRDVTAGFASRLQ